MSFFKNLFNSKVTIITDTVLEEPKDTILTQLDKLLVTDIAKLDKLLLEPDCMLYGLLMHTNRITDINAISRALHYKINDPSIYSNVSRNLTMIELGMYLYIGTDLHFKTHKVLSDVKVIYSNYISKDSLTVTEELVLSDIKTLLSAIDELTQE